MARVGNLIDIYMFMGNLASSSSEDQEVKTGSLNPESGLTNQEVGQPGMDDNDNPEDFHQEEKGEDDGAAGLPEEVEDHPSLPASPSETPSLQPGEVLIQEKVLMARRPKYKKIFKKNKVSPLRTECEILTACSFRLSHTSWLSHHFTYTDLHPHTYRHAHTHIIFK